MTNKTQIECYFKSSDMAELCKDSTDVVIYFKASYPPDSPPVFDISADSYNNGAKTKKSIKSKTKGALTEDSGGGKPGCPTPCK